MTGIGGKSKNSCTYIEKKIDRTIRIHRPETVYGK